jgi:GNAT superfamily N-acetyltransferase
LCVSFAVLEHDGFDANPPMFSCLVSEQKDKNLLCGYAMYYAIYSGREGKAMWLEDIYVSPICRKQGIGRALFSQVAQVSYLVI